MANVHLTEGTWRQLEEALIERLEGARPDPPWAARWLVVPHSGVRTRLQTWLARRLGALAGLRLLYLHEAAAALLESGGGRAPVLLDELARDLLLRESIRRHRPAVEALLGGSARVTPAFHHALRKTVYDLREGGIAPHEVAALAHGHSERPRRRLQMVAEVYGDWSEQLDALGDSAGGSRAPIYDREGLLRAAASALAAGARVPAGQVIVYGFYDLTGGQTAFLDALGDAGPLDLLIPVYPESETYTGALLRHWRRQSGRPDDEGEHAPGQAEPAERHRWLPLPELLEHLAGAGAQAEGQGSGPPEATVTISSAPGPAREVDLALRLLAAAFSAGVPASRCRLAAPSADRYARLLTQEAEAGGFGRSSPESQQAPGAMRRLLAALDLVDAPVAAATLAEALAELMPPAEAPAPSERLLREQAPAASVAEWIGLLEAEAGACDRRLEAWEREAAAPETAGDDPEARPDRRIQIHRLKGRRESLEAAGRHLAGLAGWLSELPDQAGWRQWADCFEAWLEPGGEGPEGATAWLERLRGLAVLDEPAGRDEVGWVLRRLLADGEPAPPVPFGSIMDLRGRDNRLTVVLGMDESGWPRRPSPDPLLLDAERRQLRPERDWLLADSRHRLYEDHLLFRLLLESARHVVLLYPRLDSTGKIRRASPHLLALARRLLGSDLNQDALEEQARRGVRPLDEPGPGSQEPLLGRLDRDLAAVRQAIEQSDRRNLDALWASPTFAAGWRAENERWQGGPGAWSGFLSGEAARLAARRFGAEEGGRLSVSRLEAYATCPWRAFLRYVLGLPEQSEPPSGLLDPLERGQVLHDVLETFVHQENQARRWPPQEEHRAAGIERLGELLDRRIERAYRERGQRAPVPARVEGRRMLARLREWLAWEGRAGAEAGAVGAGSRAGGWVPEAFELAIEAPLPAGGHRFILQGRIDRVDRGPGGCRRLIDYKTGAGRLTGPEDLAGGTNLQIPLYLKAVREAPGDGGEWVGGVLLQLRPEGRTEAHVLTAERFASIEDDLAQVVAGLLESVRRGVFVRGPHEKKIDSRSGGLCRNCPAPIICRAWREQQYRRHLRSEPMHPLNRVRALHQQDDS